MITSHPGYSEEEDYPNRFRRTDVITVKEGSHIEVDFTSFDVEYGGDSCYYDYLTVTDGDGTTLIKRLCGRVRGPAGYGYGPGYGGYGDGYGDADGYGDGDGYGAGDGYGYGDGDGDGYGYGYGYGYGNNSSEDNGNFSAVNGSGNGYGNNSRRHRQAEDDDGYGYGSGYGYGNNSSEGNGIEISLENILDKTITSHTNVLIFTFATDGSVTGRGWSANWKSVTPGLQFTFGHSSIICPGCPKNPPYPGDQCYPTDDDDDCDYSISEEKDCNNCGCDYGPSSVGVCGQEKDEEKITFSCSESWPGIWKPVHESSVCNSSGKQSYHCPPPPPHLGEAI